MLLKLLLPMKKHTLESLLDQVVGIQVRNHRAYQSHREKRLKELNQNYQLAL